MIRCRRVGDSPIPGSGAYADSEVGAAAATGDGDVMMRLSPSLLAVESMRRGASPPAAAEEAVARIALKYPDFVGAIIAMKKAGEVATASLGLQTLPKCVANCETGGSVLRTVSCMET